MVDTNLSYCILGYQMMAKMGFKASENTVQPLEINLRRGRGGLGLYEEQKVKHEAEEEIRLREESKRRKEYELETENMLHRQSLNAARGRVSAQLFSMLRLVFNLRQDSRSIRRTAVSEDGEVIDDPPPLVADAHIQAHFDHAGGMSELRELLSSMSIDTQQLHHSQLNRYLREDFLYCFYCAHSFESPEALAKLCPGVSEEDHQNATIPHTDSADHASNTFSFASSSSMLTSMDPDEHASDHGS